MIKQRLAKVDQANPLEKVKVWRGRNEDDFFEFRPYVNPPAESENAGAEGDSVEEGELEEERVDDGTSNRGLLFVYQAKWQQHLLDRYGNELCLLDATYRTTKYSLPLYFLVVKTNMEYKVVASFVTQSETMVVIKESLYVIKNWNPDSESKTFYGGLCRGRDCSGEGSLPRFVQHCACSQVQNFSHSLNCCRSWEK